MRQPLTKELLNEALIQLASRSKGTGRLYITGGACAVYEGWRESTLDIDLKLDPEPQGIYEAIQYVKRHHDINIELAAPSDFIPEVPGWGDRSQWINRYQGVDIFHYDFVSQALSKIERGNEQDLSDVNNMLNHQKTTPEAILDAFEEIRPHLIKYPRITEVMFEYKVREALELWRLG